VEGREELGVQAELVLRHMLQEPKPAVRFGDSWLATILDKHVSWAPLSRQQGTILTIALLLHDFDYLARGD
jgi:hypothetical protein